ncbi:hypothetical protein AAC387_Pa11g0696 [Persea americana]
MGRQSKASKQESFGKGKVTPVQVAFMVDRYLSDNNYTKTLSVFRTEASNLLTRTRGGQAPKGLLSLGAILDEYICLKEQKLMVDNERNRVERLLQGMQAAMNAYNSAGSVSQVATTPSPPMGLRNGSHEDRPIYNNHTANTVRMLPSNTSDSTNSSTRIVSHPSMKKRKASRPDSDVSPAVKKSGAVLPMNSLAAAATKIPSQEANNISLSELLDMDLSSEEMGLPFQQALEPSLDFITRQTNELGYGGIEANRDSFEPSLSGVNKFLSENGICSQGPESIISVKSITKCIQIVSPAKKRMNSSSDRTDKTVTHLHHVYS